MPREEVPVHLEFGSEHEDSDQGEYEIDNEHEDVEMRENMVIEGLKSKLAEEFMSSDGFTLDDVNDAFGALAGEGQNLYEEDQLNQLVDAGYLNYDTKLKEYSLDDRIAYDKAA